MGKLPLFGCNIGKAAFQRHLKWINIFTNQNVARVQEGGCESNHTFTSRLQYLEGVICLLVPASKTGLKYDVQYLSYLAYTVLYVPFNARTYRHAVGQ